MIVFFVLMILISCYSDIYPGLNFVNRSSTLVVQPSAKLYLNETDSINGWSRESITQPVGFNTPSYWYPAWTGSNLLNYELVTEPSPYDPDGNGDIEIDTYYYELTDNLHLGPNRLLKFFNSVSTNYTFVNGNGYSLDLAEGIQSLIQIEAGHTVEFYNVIITNYNEDAILLPISSTLRFLSSAIEFNDNRLLTRPLTLQGDVIINGYGYTVDLTGGGSIVLESGSLSINNLIIYGLDTQNLRCAYNSAFMSMQNCNLFMTNDFRYRVGGLIMQDSVIGGFNIFSYESSKTFTIDNTVQFDTGMTFSYSPPVAKNDLIYMYDESRLYLNGCTIKTTNTGLQLTTGTLIIDSQNQVYNVGGTTYSEAIFLGNGIPSNDLDIEILPGARFDLKEGVLVYANVN